MEDHRPQDLRQPVAGLDFLGVHAMDTSDPANPQIVHASSIATHPTTASRRRGTRSACGRPRPTTPSSTARSSPMTRSLVCPAGFAGAGLFHVAVFAWALLGFAAVYTGIAQRAFDEVVASVPRRRRWR